MSIFKLASYLRKDAPSVSDVHISSTGKKPRKPLSFGSISQETKLPVTGADLAAQQENPDDDPKAVSKAAMPRALKPKGEGVAHTPFPHDVNALGNLRPDQVPRFMGALTSSDGLEDRNVSMNSLVAMQDRVDPEKVDAMRGKEPDASKKPVVVRTNGRNYIADGHHRLTAQYLDGANTAEVKFKDLSRHDEALKALNFGKAGARHNRHDRAAVQAIHDHACALGADCEQDNTDEDNEWADEAVDALGDIVDNELGKAWSLPVKIEKTDDDKCLVFGWASVIEKDGKPVEDLQGDVILPADLEDAVYAYVLDKRDAGEMHDRVIGVGKLVESLMMTREKQAAMGLPEGSTPLGWWVGYKLSKEVFAKVKSGEYPMFSIGGGGVREG